MRLENNVINIRDVKFAGKTEIKDGVLYINRPELQNVLQEDRRLGQVDIELAHPGESCRILQVADVVEPRAKISGGEDFPGALGGGTAGQGSTCVLRGTAVVVNNQSRVSGFAKDPIGDLVDMSGAAAELTPYAKTHNVVVIPYPAGGVSNESQASYTESGDMADMSSPTQTVDYKVALKLAGLKTAVYLANAGKNIKPDEVEVYDLPSLPEISKGIEDLPKVAYVFMMHCQSHPSLPGEPILYGNNVLGLTPTVLHPNEVLDGAIVVGYYGFTIETYAIQNHPLIKELYRRHGKDLCFVGVVVYTSKVLEPERERATAIAANLTKSILGADGAIFTYLVGGAPEIDMAQTAKKCEDSGTKALLLMRGLPDGKYTEVSKAHMVQDLVHTIVNMGDMYEVINLPPVDRIIGKNVTSPEGRPVNGELQRLIMFIRGAIGQFGDRKRVSVPY